MVIIIKYLPVLVRMISFAPAWCSCYTIFDLQLLDIGNRLIGYTYYLFYKDNQCRTLEIRNLMSLKQDKYTKIMNEYILYTQVGT